MRSHDEFKDELLQRKTQRIIIRRNRKMRLLTSGICLLLCLVLLAAALLPGTNPDSPLSPFVPAAQAADLMAGIQANNVAGKAFDDTFIASQMDFAVKLFQSCYGEDTEKNTLVSPLSVMLALAMTANGADGQTKAEMEAVLGMPSQELNQYLRYYVDHLPTSHRNKVTIANSVWYRDSEQLYVKETFLQTVADYYGADAYKAPFDSQTVKDINGWVSENTDGLIDKIVDRIDDSTVMYLINTLLLNLEWKQAYTDESLWNGKFTAIDGTKQSVVMMRSYDGFGFYLSDDRATGFMKHYADNQYAFVALLPNDGISVEDYVNSLTGESLSVLLSGGSKTPVHSLMPKFSYDYSLELKEILADLGMPSAFSSEADLSRMADEQLLIGSVLHKTHITLDQAGTRVAAVTSVQVELGSVPSYDIFINLNRPFVYMIIDTATNLPLFMGTVMSVEN